MVTRNCGEISSPKTSKVTEMGKPSSFLGLGVRLAMEKGMEQGDPLPTACPEEGAAFLAVPCF